MASQAPIPLHANDVDSQATSEDDRIAAFDDAEDVEPVQPSVAARQQSLGLVASMPTTTMLAGGALAVLLGGGVGYWLGSRRSVTATPARKVKRAAATAEHTVELLPVAMHLLANPMVRSLVIRMLLRRFVH